MIKSGNEATLSYNFLKEGYSFAIKAKMTLKDDYFGCCKMEKA